MFERQLNPGAFPGSVSSFTVYAVIQKTLQFPYDFILVMAANLHSYRLKYSIFGSQDPRTGSI